MSSKKSSKKDQAKKGTKPKPEATAEQAQVTTPVDEATTAETTPAEAATEPVQTEAAPVETPPTEVTAGVEQPTAEPAQTGALTAAPASTTIVWPAQPTTHETDIATYNMWTTVCGRYRVYLMNAKLNGQSGHFNAEVRNGDGGFHSIEQAKDGGGRPRDYRTLASAVEACRLHFAGVQSGASSEEEAMLVYAHAHELDVLPATGEPQAEEAKGTKRTKKASKPREGKLSAIDAAAKVLGEAGKPMTCKEMIEAMAGKGYWSSPGGQTPWATLYSSILREIKVRGAEARFKKADRGQFALAGTGA